ncbi:MAG: glycosyltransferase, partial [Chitinophagaceae bacterium]
GLRWVDIGFNWDFAIANNVGLRIAKGDVFLLLNPDTIAIDDSIKRCYERFCESKYVACGIQLLNPDGTNQISGSYFVKGGLNHLLPIPYYGDFIRWYHDLYSKKGLQLMVSNHLRVRKQYGVGWFLFLLLNYSFGVVIFWLCSTLRNLFTLRNPMSDWKRVGAFAKNVGKLWVLSPKIISNKPHFYKMF